MFKHNVEYVDFNGNDRKEDLYFHLSTPEVTRLEAEIGKDLEVHINDLTTNQKLDELLAFLEKMILTAYGKKTSDGRSFMKTKEIREEFEYSQAYANMFEDVITNPDLAKKFGESVADAGRNRKNQIAPKVIQEKTED